ncbi:hypothetical protein BC831DRAFT_453744 [Entophlyctis helioformis]|nr:hypothetical protein BC831DRAFT_453744 [Entophlyctis helioformis]
MIKGAAASMVANAVGGAAMQPVAARRASYIPGYILQSIRARRMQTDYEQQLDYRSSAPPPPPPPLPSPAATSSASAASAASTAGVAAGLAARTQKASQIMSSLEAIRERQHEAKQETARLLDTVKGLQKRVSKFQEALQQQHGRMSRRSLSSATPSTPPMMNAPSPQHLHRSRPVSPRTPNTPSSPTPPLASPARKSQTRN